MTGLSIEDLRLTLGSQSILRGISLTVPEHGIVCVLGSNGVGKTTLMRTISGIYHSAQGALRWQGQSLLGLAPHRIVGLGIAQAPEGRHIFATMTVGENLRVGTAKGGTGELDRVLALFPILRDRWRQRAGSLSGGEQQMLCIGRALMARPHLLLLDEPSLGLAPRLVTTILDLIARIRDQGIAVLLVEQNARAALGIADHAYVLEGGRVVIEGPASDIAKERRVVDAYLGSDKGKAA
jgi:branched-chain amino acid transport system ATP-binding protein